MFQQGYQDTCVDGPVSKLFQVALFLVDSGLRIISSGPKLKDQCIVLRQLKSVMDMSSDISDHKQASWKFLQDVMSRLIAHKQR